MVCPGSVADCRHAANLLCALCVPRISLVGNVVGTRGVNRSPIFLNLRKCLNTIQISVGHPLFSWTIFGSPLVKANFTHFPPYGSMKQDSVNDIAMCIPLISGSHRTFGMQGTIYERNE